MKQATNNANQHQTIISGLIDMGLMLAGTLAAGALVVWMLVQPMVAEANMFSAIETIMVEERAAALP